MSVALNKLVNINNSTLISGLVTNHKRANENSIFFCVKTSHYDGYQYYQEAIKFGSKVVIYNKDINTSYKDVIFLKVNNVEQILINIALKFYNIQINQFKYILVCGSFEKNTISDFLYNVQNKNSAVINKIHIKYKDKTFTNYQYNLTLNENLTLLNDFKEDKIKNIIYTTSCKNLVNNDLSFIDQCIFIYTGFSRQTKDYKEVLSNYYNNYNNYFEKCKVSNAIVNIDFDIKQDYLLYFPINRTTLSMHNINADYYIDDIVLDTDSSSFSIIYNKKKTLIKSNLIGYENIYLITILFIYLLINNYSQEDCLKIIDNIKTNNSNLQHHILNNTDFLFNNLLSIPEVTLVDKYIKNVYKNNRKIVLIDVSKYSENEINKLASLFNDYFEIILFNFNINSEIHKFLLQLEKNNNSLNLLLVEDRYLALDIISQIIREKDLVLLCGFTFYNNSANINELEYLENILHNFENKV